MKHWNIPKGRAFLQRAPQWWTGAYGLFLLTVYVLYVGPEGYSSMVEPKFRLFLWSGALFFPVLALLLVLKGFFGRKTRSAPAPRHITGATTTAPLRGNSGLLCRKQKTSWSSRMPLILAGGLLVWFLLSSLLSEYPDVVWLGHTRKEGFVTLALYLAIFAVFARIPALGALHRWGGALVGAVTLLLVAMQFGGQNPLGLFPGELLFHHRGLRYAGEYLGTIGNSDLLSGLLTMLTLYLLGAYVAAPGEERPVLLFGGLCAWSALVISEVTAGPVAVLGAFALALPLCVKKGVGIHRMGDLVLVLTLPALGKSMVGYTAPEGEVSFFFQWTLVSWGLLVLVLLSMGAVLFLRRLPEGKGYPGVSRGLWLLYGATVLGTLGFLLVYSGNNETLRNLGDLLRGNPPDTLGSGRIAIWKDAIKLGLDQPLLGGGPDTYNFRSDLSFTRVLPNGYERTVTVDAAHNEYLNLWVNCGLPAMMLQMALIAAVLIPGLKKLRGRTLCLLLPVLGYGIHAMFGISQCLVSPVFYMLLGAASRTEFCSEILSAAE